MFNRVHWRIPQMRSENRDLKDIRAKVSMGVPNTETVAILVEKFNLTIIDERVLAGTISPNDVDLILSLPCGVSPRTKQPQLRCKIKELAGSCLVAVTLTRQLPALRPCA